MKKSLSIPLIALALIVLNSCKAPQNESQEEKLPNHQIQAGECFHNVG